MPTQDISKSSGSELGTDASKGNAAEKLSPSSLQSHLKKYRVNTLEFYRGNEKVTKAFPLILEDVAKLVSHCQRIGIKRNDKVGIIGGNAYEWVLIDLACIIAGYVSVAFHNNLFETNILSAFDRYSLTHLFASDQYAEPLADNRRATLFSQVRNIVESTDAQDGTQLDELSQDTSWLFTTYFTSGTTSSPKALGLTLDSCSQFMNRALELFTFCEDDKIIIFLPLSAVLERVYVYLAILNGFNILIVPVQNVTRALRVDKPTILVAVPYFFETIYSQFWHTINRHFFKKLLFRTYLAVWRKMSLGVNCRLRNFLLKDLISFWGGRMRLLLCGTAPIRKQVLEFYEAMGMPILQGYGISEIGMVALNTPDQNRLGSVGKPFPGKRITFDDQGQILIHTNEPFSTGYLDSNCEPKPLFEEGGCYATGDVGFMDEDGFLYINGRLKEMLVLCNGKKVHPHLIEEMLNSSPSIIQSIVFGEGYPHLVCVVIKRSADCSEQAIAKDISKVNTALPDFLRLRSHVVSDQRFSIENGCLTPTMKLNRTALWAKYAPQIEALYETD